MSLPLKSKAALFSGNLGGLGILFFIGPLSTDPSVEFKLRRPGTIIKLFVNYLSSYFGGLRLPLPELQELMELFLLNPTEVANAVVLDVLLKN